MSYPVAAVRGKQFWVGAAPWYLSGGIAAANCIAAYQPKGVASQAASYVNLANPGTYDAAPGTAPAWDATNGWKFTATSSHKLLTGITATNDQTWSTIAIFSNVTESNKQKTVIGTVGPNPYPDFGLYPEWEGTVRYSNGSQKDVTETAVTSGTMAVAGNKAYKNGSVLSGNIGTQSGTWYALTIGVRHGTADGNYSAYLTGYIQALAIYNTPISADQVAALHTAMSAL